MQEAFQLKACKQCGVAKPTSEFYARAEGRWDPLCKACRLGERKNAYKGKHQVALSPLVSMPPAHAAVVPSNDSSATSESKYFKEYKYPDGRVLRLTKAQFYAVVDVFRALARQDENLRRLAPQEKAAVRTEGCA